MTAGPCEYCHLVAFEETALSNICFAGLPFDVFSSSFPASLPPSHFLAFSPFPFSTLPISQLPSWSLGSTPLPVSPPRLTVLTNSDALETSPWVLCWPDWAPELGTQQAIELRPYPLSSLSLFSSSFLQYLLSFGNHALSKHLIAGAPPICQHQPEIH